MPIDEVNLHFSPDSLFLLNLCLGLIMFGVALNLRWEDFKEVGMHPKPVLIGLFSQLLVLPLLTYLLIYFFQPHGSLALGMILVAACPGGNVSNFISHLAKANVALSVSMTSVVTLLCVVSTPMNFGFWSSLIETPEALQQMIRLNFWDMTSTLLTLIIVPVILGIAFAYYLPQITAKIVRPIKFLSVALFVAFIVIAFLGNFQIFIDYIHHVIGLVFVHNAVALGSGYVIAYLFGLREREARTISIETGIQNSGLGLILIFNFFDGLGGMALIAACWGIWHLVAGMALATFWSRRDPILQERAGQEASVS